MPAACANYTVDAIRGQRRPISADWIPVASERQTAKPAGHATQCAQGGTSKSDCPAGLHQSFATGVEQPALVAQIMMNVL
jgi:hypothetical protein